MEKEKKIAVLIDADNVAPKYVKGMMDEIAKFGSLTIKRIYGDFTQQNKNGWKNILLENAIIPIQQFSYTTGKNSTDSAMIIDAMDILHSDEIDGFCLVSSDSDFTRLAMRLRESGKLVVGMGAKITPKPFISACNVFIYLEVLRGADSPQNIQQANNTMLQSNLPAKVGAKTINLLNQSIDDVADENGWAPLGEVGQLVLKKKPDFDSRNYGFKKLSLLIEACSGYFDVSKRSGNKHSVHVYVKRKKYCKENPSRA